MGTKRTNAAKNHTRAAKEARRRSRIARNSGDPGSKPNPRSNPRNAHRTAALAQKTGFTEEQVRALSDGEYLTLTEDTTMDGSEAVITHVYSLADPSDPLSEPQEPQPDPQGIHGDIHYILSGPTGMFGLQAQDIPQAELLPVGTRVRITVDYRTHGRAMVAI